MIYIFAIAGLLLLLFLLNSARTKAELRMTRMELRLDALEAELKRAAAAPASPDTSPAPAPEPAAITEPVPADPVAASEPPPLPPRTEPPPLPSSPPAAAPGRSLEETIGTRWSVWVGGLALALGALLLVRYSIEQGFFGPGFRVIAGLLFSLALAGAGEWLRRKQGPAGIRPDLGLAPPYIPGVLTGAGAVAAFGALYAAHALYGFIGPGLATFALGATGIACLYAAALHGPALAGLGLLASFATPILVESEGPNPWALVIYLAVIGSANFTFAWLRRWHWLALATAAAGGGWALAISIFADGQLRFFTPGVAHLCLYAAMAAFVIGVNPWREQGEAARLDPAAHVSLGVYALIAVTLFWAGGDVESVAWIMGLTVLVAIYAVAGLAGASLRGALPMAGALIVAALWVWPGFWVTQGSQADHLRASEWRNLGDARTFLIFAGLASLALAVLCWRQLTSGRIFNRVGLWIIAGTAVLTPLAALTTTYLRAGALTTGYGFALAAAALATLFVAAATAARRSAEQASDDQKTQRVHVLGSAASATLAAMALAFTFALEGGTLTIALALSALGAAYVAVRLDIPALRWCVAAVGIAVAARLAWDPRIVGRDLSVQPVFNWLLIGYGVPALAFGFAARLMARHAGEDTPVRIARSLSVLLSGFLVFFEIRHALNGGDIYATRHGMVEEGLHALSAFGFATVLTRLDRAQSNTVFRIASLAFAILSFAIVAVGLGLVSNPFLTGTPVLGGALFNTLLLGYALPAIAALVLARVAVGVRPGWYVSGARIATIALSFGYISLEVRRLWQGESIGILHGMEQGELYSYSAAWLTFGGLLLVYGLWRSSREVRLASAGFVTLTVLKVFLIDLSHLEGLLRAMSFIALGLVLIVIGLVYQNFVFNRPATASGPGEGTTSA